MTYHYRKSSLAGIAALAVGALVALTPASTEAASIRIQDLSGGGIADFFLSDTGNISPASIAGQPFGNMVVTVTVTPNDTGNSSVLNTVAVNTSGAGHIKIITSEDGYGAGAAAPIMSNLAFSLTSTNASKGIPSGMGYVNDSNTLEATEDQIGSTLSLPMVPSGNFNSVRTTDTAVLSDPFSITTMFEVKHDNADDFTQFTSTAVATPVPLPAAGWLMLAGLGGLAALRRRKRAA